MILYLDAMDVIRHRLVKDIIRAYTEAGGDTDSAGQRAFAAGNFFTHFFGFAQNALRVFERDFAGVGQYHAAFGADKKRHAEFFFERFHLVTDRRLR